MMIGRMIFIIAVFIYILKIIKINKTGKDRLMNLNSYSSELTGWQNNPQISKDIFQIDLPPKPKQMKIANLQRANLPIIAQHKSTTKLSSRYNIQQQRERERFTRIRIANPEIMIKQLKTMPEWELKMQRNKLFISPLKHQRIVMIQEEPTLIEVRKQQQQQISNNLVQSKTMINIRSKIDSKERESNFLKMINSQNEGQIKQKKDKQMKFQSIGSKNYTKYNISTDNYAFNRSRFPIDRNPQEKALLKLSQLKFYNKGPALTLQVIKQESNKQRNVNLIKSLRFSKQQAKEITSRDGENNIDKFMKSTFIKKDYTNPTKSISPINKNKLTKYLQNSNNNTQPDFMLNRFKNILYVKYDSKTAIKCPSRYKIIQS